jgi:ABC-type phosphonate transport system ATPase subunit
MEKLLKKEAKFQWNEESQQGLDVLRKKLVTAPILVFLEWKKEFHVHVDASSISLVVVLVNLGLNSVTSMLWLGFANLLSNSERKIECACQQKEIKID